MIRSLAATLHQALTRLYPYDPRYADTAPALPRVQDDRAAAAWLDERAARAGKRFAEGKGEQ